MKKNLKLQAVSSLTCATNTICCAIIYTVILFLILTSAKLNAQGYECYTTIIQPTVSTPTICTDYLSYIPDATNTQTLTFKVNFHFFTHNVGQGIFQPGPDHQKIIDMFTNLNTFYSSFYPPTLPVPGTPFIQNSKIQFEFKGAYYHDDDQAYFNPFGLPTSNQDGYYNQYGVNKTREVNVFFYYDPQFNGGASGGNNFINMIFNSWTPTPDMFSYAATQVLAHELGHSMGHLPHTFSFCNDDIFLDTWHPDFNTAWLNCTTSFMGTQSGCASVCQISNNIMGYNACRRYLSPKQLGYWHYEAYNLTTAAGSTTKFLTACDYNTVNSRYVNFSQTWNRSYIIGGDLIIDNNSVLTVNCSVFMTGEGKVIVKSGSTLIIDGGIFTNKCDEMWDGIIVENGGTVNVINNAKIEQADIAITLNNGSYSYSKLYLS